MTILALRYTRVNIHACCSRLLVTCDRSLPTNHRLQLHHHRPSPLPLYGTKCLHTVVAEVSEEMSLTRALASTLAALRSRMRRMSVWLARAARCSEVSPRTVVELGLAPCCSRNSTTFMWPMNAATCSGVRPDYTHTHTHTHTHTNHYHLQGCSGKL